ncbi:hypothetical protein H8E07_22570, partial [bacterium]|nr:hypothetical protein [bacterium]
MLLVLVSAVSEFARAETVTSIDVVGARTVGARQVMAWSELAEGDVYSTEAVAAAIRKLFETGKFSDVYVYRQDDDGSLRLIINLRAFPRIKQITFLGNAKAAGDDLSEAFGVTIGQLGNPA